jgi:hypothetical protein
MEGAVAVCFDVACQSMNDLNKIGRAASQSGGRDSDVIKNPPDGYRPRDSHGPPVFFCTWLVLFSTLFD